MLRLMSRRECVLSLVDQINPRSDVVRKVRTIRQMWTRMSGLKTSEEKKLSLKGFIRGKI